MKNSKKAISETITTLTFIGLAIVAIGIVWVVVNNLLQENISQTSSCFNILDKVKFEDDYTCFKSSSNELEFYLTIGNIDVDNVLISITGEEGAKSLTLEKSQSYSFLKYLNGEYKEEVSLPSKQSGKTYVINLNEFEIGNPLGIKVAPVVNGKQCEVSDNVLDLQNCAE